MAALNQFSGSSSTKPAIRALSHPQNVVLQLAGIKPEPPTPKKIPAGEKKMRTYPNGGTRYTETQMAWLRKCGRDGNVMGWKKCAKDFRARFGVEYGRTPAALKGKWRNMMDAEEDGEDGEAAEAMEAVEEVAGDG
ncbi:hypothetical protein RUND412_000944 [Rhizina undulata]